MRYYRGGGTGSMPRGKTAQDVVDYERNELGNKINTYTDDLSMFPASRCIWVTLYADDAEYYGEVEAIDFDNPLELAYDSDGGILVTERS